MHPHHLLEEEAEDHHSHHLHLLVRVPTEICLLHLHHHINYRIIPMVLQPHLYEENLSNKVQPIHRQIPLKASLLENSGKFNIFHLQKCLVGARKLTPVKMQVTDLTFMACFSFLSFECMMFFCLSTMML